MNRFSLALTFLWGLFIVAAVLLVWQQYSLQDELIEKSAIENARLYSQALAEFRTIYTSKVVEKVRAHGMEVTHDYADKDTAIPLPATLSMELGKAIGEKRGGAISKLYSAYPFPWRVSSGGLKDDFSNDAWNFLNRNPDKPFYRFETKDGELHLRYATADIMRPACVNCHNTHPETPKTGWKVGDVRGVLEISHPLGSVVVKTKNHLRQSLFLAIIVTIIGLSGLTMIVFRAKAESHELEDIVKERTIELIESKEYVSNIVGSMIDTLIVVSPEGKIRTVNDATCGLLSYIGDELLGQPVGMIIGEEQKDEEVFSGEKLQGIMKKGFIADLRVFYKAKSGKKIPMSLSGSIMHDNTGATTGIVCVARDLTVLKKSQDALNQMVNTLQIIVADSNRIARGDYSVEIRPQGDTGDLSAALQEMTVQLRERHERDTSLFGLSKSIRGIMDYGHLCRVILSHLIGELGGVAGALYSVGGDTIKLQCHYAYDGWPEHTKEFNVGENLVGRSVQENRIITVDDVPEEYRSFRLGVGQVPPNQITFFPIHFEGKINGVLELASMQSYTEGQLQLISASVEMIGGSLKNIQSRKELQGLLKETQRQQSELQIANRRMEKQTRHLRNSEEELRSINEELLEKTEILEIQKTEVEQSRFDLERKSKEIELASKYKTEFLANMSHELRTPLNSFLLLSKSLSDNKHGNLLEDQIKDLKIINEGGMDLLNLINDIMDLSKVEAGKMPLLIEEVKITNVGASITTLFRPIFQKKGLTFGVVINKNVPRTIETDAQRLEQILKNFISNAFKFTKNGSVQLEISIPNDTCVLQNEKLRAQSTIAFSVIDSGIGIAREKQNEIFEAFQQKDGSTSRKYGGTGLGLTISKGLADLLGGEIHLDSEEGSGSIFTLYLPLNADHAIRDHDIDLSVIAETPVATIETEIDTSNFTILKNRKVLLVDDDMRNIFALSKNLQDFGLVVIEADDGQTALNKLDEHDDVELVIMDIMMPIMDGYEATKKIREGSKYQNIPIIALTAKAMPEDRVKCIEAGANDYLTKPINFTELIALLNVWLFRK
ncbi:MAG: response regulator [Candidatus Lindowbacteria bacterium]|nr:response regulator [Candidatus Lindowbacteria bacterium]